MNIAEMEAPVSTPVSQNVQSAYAKGNSPGLGVNDVLTLSALMAIVTVLSAFAILDIAELFVILVAVKVSTK